MKMSFQQNEQQKNNNSEKCVKNDASSSAIGLSSLQLQVDGGNSGGEPLAQPFSQPQQQMDQQPRPIRPTQIMLDPNQTVYYYQQQVQGAGGVLSSAPVFIATGSIVTTTPPLKDHLILSIFMLICCNCPLGSIALFFSILTRKELSRNNIQDAIRYSKISLILNWLALALTFVCY